MYKSLDWIHMYKTGDRIKICCVMCQKEHTREKRSILKAIKKRGGFFCQSCIMTPLLKERGKEIINDLEWRKNLSLGVKRAHKEGKFAQKSEITKRLWRKPDYRKKQATKRRPSRETLSAAIKKHFESPQHRHRQSTITKKLWKDPSYRIRRAIGLSHAMTPEVRRKLSDSSKRLWADRQYRAKQALTAALKPTRSILEEIANRCIKDMGFSSRPFAHGPWVFDIIVEEKNVIIEVQGDYIHSLDEVVRRDARKRQYFDECLSNIYSLHYLYEHEFYALGMVHRKISNILEIAVDNHDFLLSDVVIRFDDRRGLDFLRTFHYMSKYRYGIVICAYLGDQIIAALTFSPITRVESAKKLGLDHKSVLELSRLCMRPGYNKKNFCSWFISRAIKLLPEGIKALITFADTTLGHTGSVYKAVGWRYDGEVKPTYWYINQNGHYLHKKSIWDQSSRQKMTEPEYANKFGLIKIKGKKLKRFVKFL